MEGIIESDSSNIVNSQVTVLISKITKMLKNPAIESDLSQVLDDFLEKLNECDKYIENGIFNINFAEAALLLQSSADLYSKKVDILWDVIFDYQKRLLLSEEKNTDKEQEIEKLEERKRKYKRKRKINVDESQTAQLVNNFSFGQVENCNYLSQGYDTCDLSKEWEKFHIKETGDNILEHIASKNSLFLPSNSIYTEDKDYIGRYDQFHSASLVDEIFHLEKNNLLTDEFNCITQMRIDSYLINDFLLHHSIPSDRPYDTFSTQLNEYVNNFLKSHNLPEKDSQVSCNSLEQIFCKKSYVSLQRLPFNIVREKLRRHSLADSLFDDDHMSFISERCPSPSHSVEKLELGKSFDTVASSLENRSKSCSQDSAFYEDMDETGNHEEIHNETVEESGVSATAQIEDKIDASEIAGEVDASVSAAEKAEEADAALLSTAEIAEDVSTNNDQDLPQSMSEDVTTDNVEAALEDTDMVEKLRRGKKKLNDTDVTRSKVSRKWTFLLGEDEEETRETATKKRRVTRRLSRKMLEKLATGLTVPQKDFERFCRFQYKPSEGEGVAPAYISEPEEDSDEDDVHRTSDEDDFDRDDVVHHREEVSDLEEDEENGNNQEQEEANDDDPQVPSDLPDLIHPCISPIPDSNLPGCSTNPDLIGHTSTPYRPSNDNDDLEEDTSCRKVVRDWRAYIIPKLRMLENRADFDIHEYGSQIIEPSQIGETRHFKDIVKEKSAAEVCRYFIATLQLANTYNVEISGASGEVANDSFQIKTLDKTKHHELLEDYQAPSEETFRERLERCKASTPVTPRPGHSTFDLEVPNKRRKYGGSSRKKLF